MSDAISGDATVRFDIVESPKIAIQSIAYKGVRSIKPKVLNRIIQTRRKICFHGYLFGTLIHPADERFNAFAFFIKIRAFDVVVDPERVEYNFEKNKRAKIIVMMRSGILSVVSVLRERQSNRSRATQSNR